MSKPQSHFPSQQNFSRVVDVPIRVLHWLMALSFLGAYLTAELDGYRPLHVMFGYTLIAVVVARLVWGLIGPRSSSVSMLFKKAKRSLGNVLSVMTMPSKWTLAIKQSQGIFTLLLLGLSIPLVVSGYALYTLNAGEPVEELHELLANAMLISVLFHIAVVVLTSVVDKKFAAKPMMTGRSFNAGPDIVRANTLLGVVLLVTAALVWGWQYQQTNGFYDANATSDEEGNHEEGRHEEEHAEDHETDHHEDKHNDDRLNDRVRDGFDEEHD